MPHRHNSGRREKDEEEEAEKEKKEKMKYFLFLFAFFFFFFRRMEREQSATEAVLVSARCRWNGACSTRQMTGNFHPTTKKLPKKATTRPYNDRVPIL